MRKYITIFWEKFATFLPELFYLKILFWLRHGHKLNLNNPQTFSEKLQWLKIYDHNPLYTDLVDKYKVKDIVSNIIGNEHIIPTFGVWDKPNKIDWDTLPNEFVLKTTHGGGKSGVVICRNKQTFDKENAIKSLEHAYKQDIYITYKEWPYKNVKKQVLAEKYISQPDNLNLIDYKFFCFNGTPKFLYVRDDNGICFVTMDWQLARFGRIDSPVSTKLPEKPKTFDKMKEIATILSQNLVFVRVDLYYVDDKIYFSELTFFPSSGLLPFIPKSIDCEIGNLLSLPNISSHD